MIVETVSYTLFPGVSREAFLQANGAMAEWLSRQEGFGQRYLIEADDGGWFDIVHWASRAALDAAQASFEKEMTQSDFFKMFDPASPKWKKGEVVGQVQSSQAAE